jgi:ABC-2 type transport system permease protein
MIGFLKLNCLRLRARKYYLLISGIMTVVSILLAIVLTTKLSFKLNIAVVNNPYASGLPSKYIQLTQTNTAPAMSELVSGKYDGILTYNHDKSYKIFTIKNIEYKKELEMLIKNPAGFAPDTKDVRGVGSNITGYLLMFLLIQCILYMFTLAEDMELKQLDRIASSPISFFKYMIAHFLFTFSLVFVPSIIALAFFRYVINLGIGFSLFQYLLLLCLICAFGTGFSMFINSLFRKADTANMLGSAIVMLTTLLSGSFYSFDKGNPILEKLLWALPQKSILSFTQGLEKGNSIIMMLPQLSYMVLLTIIFVVFSVFKIRKSYVLHRS